MHFHRTFHHDGRYETAALAPGLSREIPPEALEWRKSRAGCSLCKQRIQSVSRLHTREGKAFHWNCVQTYDRRQAVATSASVGQSAAPQVIGTLCGVAVPFGVPCFIPPNGSRLSNRSERFDHRAFDGSIAAGGQVVKIDHAGAAIPGRLQFFASNDLRFRFKIFDSPAGRDLLEHAQRGRIAGVSIAFSPIREHFDAERQVEIVDEATLTEISMCVSGGPSWYGTSVWLED
jgi:HK97 family phage prohead protease